MKWNDIAVYAMRVGELVSWLGDEAELSGSMIDCYGSFDDNLIGQPITGRIGLHRFEVLSYDKDTDLFRVKRLNVRQNERG